MQYLIYPIAIYALLIFIRYLITFLLLCKTTLQYPKYQVPTSDKVPVYLKKLFKTPVMELEKFGFKPCSYLQIESMVKSYPPITWEILLYNKALKTYAMVGLRRPVEPVNLFDIGFYTFFQDRSVLLTMNGKAHGLLDEIPNYIIQDPYTAQTSVQWQTHQDGLNQLSATKTPCSLAPETFAKALQTYGKNYVNCLAKAGKIWQIQGAESFQLNWLAALKMLNKILHGGKKTVAIVKQRKQQAKTDSTIQVEIPVELEVEGFQRMEQMQQGLVGKRFRTWLLVGSLGLFIVSYTKFFAPHSLAIFLAALIFHEGGHLLAMKLCGYQDTSVLFVPFLGAVATARKEDATLTQKFWISLAGPLPGLILGVALAIATRDGSYPVWVKEASWMLIGLNLFNLLPVYPLDGGQIADLLLFSGHPYIGVLFKVFGVILLVLLGLGKPMLLLFAILIALTIPNSFRSAKAYSKFPQELRQNLPADRDHLLHSIFKHMKQWGSSNLPFSKRYALAKYLIQRHYESHTKWTTRVLLIIVYCGSLLGGIAGSLQAISPRWVSLLSYSFESPKKIRDRITKDKQQEVERATEALRNNPLDVDAYVKRARARTWLRDPKGALADYDQVVRLKPNNISYRLTRAGFRSTLRDHQGAIQDYDQVLRLNPRDLETYRKRAHIRNMLGDYKKAFDDYSEIIRLDSKNIWAYLDRGYVCQKLQDYKGAIADANSAIALKPNQPDAYTLRSEVRRRLGDDKGALADAQKADALDKAIDKVQN